MRRALLNRRGGNTTTRYNWELDADNRGTDRTAAASLLSFGVLAVDTLKRPFHALVCSGGWAQRASLEEALR